MEGELNNFMLVWATVLLSLYYCHTVDRIFPQGILRKLAIIPIACLFFYLPLNLTTIHLGGTTSFFIAWLASFKLLLFAFNKGPLSFSSSSKPIPLSRFIPSACLPIKFHLPPSSSSQEHYFAKKNPKSSLIFVIKIVLLALCIRVYSYKDSIPQKIIWFFYCLHLYIALELLLVMLASLARGLLGVELEPQFDEPYLATSLQDFWGRRWNLMVSNILRPAVYEPVRSVSTSLIGKKWSSLPAMVATFLVSGIMHELVFYNIGRLKPNGEVMCFFLLHGVCVAVEVAAKRALKGKIWIPGIVSGPLTIAFVIYTSFWLFFPPFLRGRADWKGCTESLAFVEFVRHQRLISPSNFTCPFL